MTDFKYDVAFSFLLEDEALAVELNDRLKPRLRTFVYTERQKEIAGTDGEQTFNHVFGQEARSVIVLHRSKWGSTPWTRIEETAIKNRGYDHGYDFVLFIPLDKASAPIWLPKTRIWIGLNRWGLETAAGVIEARVQELGGSPHEESVEQLAERLQRQNELTQQRSNFLQSEVAAKLANTEFYQLVTEVKSVVSEIKGAANSFNFRTEEDRNLIVVLGGGRSLSFAWHPQYSNILKGAKLFIKFWDGFMPTQGRAYNHRAQEIRIWEAEVDCDTDLVIGWRVTTTENRIFTTKDLVGHCMKQFLQDVQELRD
jgi:hypothetical protein